MTWHLIADIASVLFTVLVLIAYFSLRAAHRAFRDNMEQRLGRILRDLDRAEDRTFATASEMASGFEALGLTRVRKPSLPARTDWVKEETK